MRQYKREPLSDDEVNRLTTACQSFREKLIVLTLLDSGLRVSELAGLRRENILWQEKRLTVYGKGGPFGKLSKRRVLPMTERVRFLIEHHYTVQDTFGITSRQIQRVVKRLAQRAGIAKPVSPHASCVTSFLYC